MNAQNDRPSGEKKGSFPVRDFRVTNILLAIIAVFAVGAFLRLARSVLFSFAIALLLFFICRRIVNLFSRKLRIPHILTSGLVVLLLLAGGGLMGMLVYSSGRSLVRLFPVYQERFFAYVETLSESLQQSIPYLGNFSIDEALVFSTLRSILVRVSSGFMGFISNFLTILILLFFLLLEEPYFIKRISLSWDHETRKKTLLAFNHIDQQIGDYLSIKVLVSLITAIFSMGVLLIVGQDFPFLWTALIFFFNFIPIVGSVVITLACIAFSILQFLPDWQPVLIVGSVLFATQIIVGNIVDPKLMGEKLKLSPLVILLSLLCWGWLWGISGVFLAIPLTLFLKVVLTNVWKFRGMHIFFTEHPD